MPMTEKDLIELKNKIRTAKSKLDRLEGQKEHLVGELKNKWDCTSVKDAKKKIQDMQDDVERLQTKIDEGTKELEELL
jgi:hypothetical protein